MYLKVLTMKAAWPSYELNYAVIFLIGSIRAFLGNTHEMRTPSIEASTAVVNPTLVCDKFVGLRTEFPRYNSQCLHYRTLKGYMEFNDVKQLMTNQINGYRLI